MAPLLTLKEKPAFHTDMTYRCSMDARDVQFCHPHYDLDQSTGCLISKGSMVQQGALEYSEELLNYFCTFIEMVLQQSLKLDKVIAESTHVVYTSKNWTISEKLLVFVCSSRHLSPGVWSRSALLKYGLEYGSMLPYLQQAQDNGFGIVMIHSVGSEMDSVMQSIWQDYIFPTAAHKINFITYGYGGVLMLSLLQSNLRDIKARLGGICFIESSHRVHPKQKALKQILSQRAISWERTKHASFAQEVFKSQTGCICLSAGSTSHTSHSIKDAVFRFFNAQSAFEFARSEAKLVNRRIAPVEYAKGITIDDFDLLKVIGKGAFGKVMLVRKRKGLGKGKIYAVKVLRKGFLIHKNQVEHTKAERRILQVIDHPFIVKLRFAFQNQEKLYLVMDYYSGGNLYFHLHRQRAFKEDLAKFLSAQLLLAIAHLHSLDIAYRDLKLENILVDADGYIALTDFGLSREDVRGAGAETFCGTAEYIAPELLRGQPYGSGVDWWSFGVLLYEMMTGQTPFYASNRKNNFYNILHSDVKYPETFSDEAKSILRGLLTRNPNQRLGSGPNRTQELMDHPFYSSINWEMLYKKEIASPLHVRVKGQTDISNISSHYTREKAKDSIVIEKMPSEQHIQFEDFSYMDHDAI